MPQQIPFSNYSLGAVDRLFVKRRKGFALISALMLMGFLLLLMLGMSTLVRVETFRVEEEQKQALARQNAKMALMMAVGELQRTLGPDARTSTQADIMYGDDVGSYQSRWVGVWRMPEPSNPSSFPDGIDPRSKPELITWLVGGNETSSPGDLTFEPTSFSGGQGSSQDTVVLHSKAEPGLPEEWAANHSEIKAPKVEVSNGSFAWWVGDEGVKYKINSVAENYDAGAAPLFPLGNSADFFSKGFDVNFSQPHNYWGKVLSFDSISTSNPDLDRLEPHLTLYSYGVLADSLRGGLRFDLSAITKMSKADFTSQVLPHLPQERIYGEYVGDFSGTTSAEDGKGPEWMMLRNYGDLSTFVGNEGVEIRAMERSSAGSGMERVDSIGIFPVMEKFQVYISVRLGEDETPDDEEFATFRPRVYYLPAIVLWNPYDKPIIANDMMVFRWMYRDRRYGWGQNYAAGIYDLSNNWVEYTIPGGIYSGKEGVFPLTHSGGDGNRTDFRLWGEDAELPIVIPAGEAIVFTMGKNEGLEPDETNEFDMEPGFRNFGFYVDTQHSFKVPREDLESEDFSGVFVDVRSRSVRVSNPTQDDGGLQGFDFRLYLGEGDDAPTLQRMMSLLFPQTERTSAVRPTVSRITNPNDPRRRYGQDPFGSEPVQFRIPGDLGFPGENVPALSIGETAVIGFEVGLHKPNPKITLHASYTREGLRPFASMNPRGAFNIGRWKNFGGVSQLYYQTIVFQNQSTGGQANQTQQVETWNGDTSTYLGYSDSSSGAERFMLFHLPEQGEAISSVGELRHLDLVGTDLSMAVTTEASRKKLDGGPSFVVGEARADPYIPLDSYQANVFPSNTDTHRHVDHQWLANRQIWDRFFVSTIPQNNSITFPLENGRMIPVKEDSLLGSGFTPTFDNVASGLVVDGAFNINSTSVPAWRAVLAQFWSQPVMLENASSFETQDASPFIDLPLPLSGPYMGGDSSTSELYTGYRHLTEDEIDDLAEEIVRLVKARGPFVSLADFINRSVNPTDKVFEDDGSNLPAEQSLKELANDPRLFGLLQAAIEKAGLNDDLGPTDDYYVTTNAPYWKGDTGAGNDSDLFVLPATVGSFVEGAPGYLTQGKLLQRLGPILSARSDTFRIRTYGDVRNPTTNEVEARVYAEAIVQRMPDYVDAADSAETLPSDLVSAENRDFGRQFKIIHFQWLNPEDIAP